MKTKYLCRIIFSAIFCWGILSFAQSNSGFDITDTSSTVIIRADGTSTTTQKTVYKITGTLGINALAVQDILYFADSERVRVLQAEVQNGDEITKSELNHLESIKGPSQTFSDRFILKVPFKNLKIGSLATLQTETILTKPPLKGAISIFNVYGSMPQILEKNRFIARKPLYKFLSDPKNLVKVQQRKAGLNSILDVEQIKSLSAIEKNYAYLEISTLENWDAFRQELSPTYQQEFKKPLPDAIAKELAGAAKLTEESQKIQWVVEKVNQLLNFSNELPKSSFDYYPRPIATILKSKAADAKDFAELTALLLRHLNVRAEIVFANTTKDSKGFIQKHLPIVRAFYHVLVSAGTPSVYIDATLGKDALAKIKTLGAGWYAVNLNQIGSAPYLIEIK